MPVISSLKQLIPAAKKSTIVANIDRILQPVTDFVRGNSIVSTASVGAGVTGLVTAVAVVRKKKKAKKKKAKPRKKKAKKKTKRGRARDRKFRSKQKHELAYVKRKRKAGKKITRPQYKTRKKKLKRFVKGSKAAKAFMAKLRRMRK